MAVDVETRPEYRLYELFVALTFSASSPSSFEP